MTYIDTTAWVDISRHDISDGSITRESEGTRQSAEVTCRAFPEQTEVWCRIYLDTSQEGERADHNALFTGIAITPKQSKTSAEVELYSVLQPLDNILLPRGWFAAQGATGGSVIEDLLSYTPAPHHIAAESPPLSSAIIAEDDETALTMLDKVLDAINWQLVIHGDGMIDVRPYSRDAVATYDPIEFDMITASGIDRDYDWFECPNVLRATYDDMSATARDDDPASFFSTVSRGREIWLQEEAELSDDETLAEYAARRLREEQRLSVPLSYKKRFDPTATVGDLIYLHYPDSDADGLYRIKSQKLDLSYGCHIDEGVEPWTA